MATLVLTNAYISVGGTVLSDHANSVTLNYESDSIEITAFGDTRHKITRAKQNNS